jgi:hypothetical protein
MLAALITLGVAFTIIVSIFAYNTAQTTYDTFAGNVRKLPLNITSPVYGQIINLPEHEGDTVRKGQTLATIHILNPVLKSVLKPATLPASSAIYHVKGTQLRIESPVDGIVGQISSSPLSITAEDASLMLLYVPASMEVRILLPPNNDIHDYTAFYAVSPSGKRKYLLHVIGQIPTDVLPTVDPTTSVYRASCVNCQSLMYSETITISAQKKQAHYPLIDALYSWWNTAIIAKF